VSAPAVRLPNLNITARSLFTPGEGWRVVFYFDHVFLVGDAAATTARLVAHWGMTHEVAKSVVGELYDRATAEDSDGVAEVLLVDNCDADGNCYHDTLDFGDGGPWATVTCEDCGVEMEYSGDGLTYDRDDWTPIS